MTEYHTYTVLQNMSYPRHPLFEVKGMLILIERVVGIPDEP